MMDNVAFWTLIAGCFVLLMIVLFSALAFRNRRSQLLSLMLARPFLMLAGSLEVIVQGGCWSGSLSGEPPSSRKPTIQNWLY
jgi:hypothetical protein